MKTFEISRLSSKGQVVIPNSIRKKLKISNGIKMAVLTDGKNILLKPIQQPRMEVFNKLIRQSRRLINKTN